MKYSPPSLKPQKFTFFIKGTIFSKELTTEDNPLEPVVIPYYKEKENFIVATPAFTGKTQTFLKIFKNLKSTKIIVSETKYDNCQCVTYEEFEGASKSYEHVIFDNLVPERYPEAHISIFIDYCSLGYGNSLDFYKSLLISKMPPNFTIICTNLNTKKIEFLFGTSAEVKHIALDSIENINGLSDCLLFSTSPVNIPRVNAKNITSVPNKLKCKKFIFYDLETSSLENVIERVDDIAIIYTKEDFYKMKIVVEVFDKMNVEVPEHIRRIASKK